MTLVENRWHSGKLRQVMKDCHVGLRVTDGVLGHRSIWWNDRYSVTQLEPSCALWIIQPCQRRDLLTEAQGEVCQGWLYIHPPSNPASSHSGASGGGYHTAELPRGRWWHSGSWGEDGREN